MKALISSDKVPAPPGPYSPGLTVGEWIFLSGQGGFDPNTGKVVSHDLAEQTEQTFNNIETGLRLPGHRSTTSFRALFTSLTSLTSPRSTPSTSRSSPA